MVDAALYDPDHGFYATAGGAGRRGGDFITSPEVGPLFGAVLARALDRWWDDLGRPVPYTVVEAGAGTGTLARSILAAAPRCLSALRYLLVERSATLRSHHRDHLPLAEPAGPSPSPAVISLGELPHPQGPAVVVANELLDNLPFDLLERGDGRWHEVRVDLDETRRRLVEHLVPLPEDDARRIGRLVAGAPDGARIAIEWAAAEWLRDALDVGHGGRVVVLDYADTTPSMAARPWTEWVRTYRHHQRGNQPLGAIGTQDITVEVAVDQLAAVRPPDADRSQSGFLTAHGLEALVEEGRRVWSARAHLGDLEAVRARSRITEAAALTDPRGLGAFRVIEWIG